MEKKPVFLSYSNNDKDKMGILEELIQSSSNLTPLVIAKNKEPMKHLTEKVSEGIVKSAYIVPILTTKSYVTQWINQEIGYASALNRKDFIFPIIETNIITKLKGFIHSQVDCSYSYDAHRTKTKDTKNFTDVACSLVEALNKAVKTDTPPESKVHSLSDIFNGTWINSNRRPDGRTDSEKVQFKRNNQYWVDGKHIFDLKNVFVSEDLDVVVFTKVGVGGDKRQAKNSLMRNADGSYSGFEDETTAIEYKRVPPPPSSFKSATW